MSFIHKLGLSGLLAATVLLVGIGASILGVGVPVTQPSPFVSLVIVAILMVATYVVVYRVATAITEAVNKD